uniref:FLYWCH-type domain-containing protein n=1 Tax=Trichogramma kaykai TaxID=54128 RepID=A0ABD2WHP9_9HYME
MSLRLMYRCSEQSFNKGPRTLEGNSHAPRTQQRAISFLDDKSSSGLFRTVKTAYTHKHTDTNTARGKHRSGLSPSRLFRISPAAILCRLPERGQGIQERRKKGFSVITFDNTRHSSKAIRRKEVRNVFLFSCPNIVCARRLCIQCIHYTRGAYAQDSPHKHNREAVNKIDMDFETSQLLPAAEARRDSIVDAVKAHSGHNRIFRVKHSRTTSLKES